MVSRTHQLTEFLSECTTQVQQFLALFDTIQYLRVLWWRRNFQVQKRKEFDARIRELASLVQMHRGLWEIFEETNDSISMIPLYSLFRQCLFNIWLAVHTTLLTWPKIWPGGILLYCSKMVLAGSFTQSNSDSLLFISCLTFSFSSGAMGNASEAAIFAV